MLQKALNSNIVRWAMQIWDETPDKLKVWIKGAVAAMEGAISVAIIQDLADPTIHGFSMVVLKHLAAGAVTGAVVALRMYVRTSPLKPVIAEVVQSEWDGINRRGESRSNSAGAGINP